VRSRDRIVLVVLALAAAGLIAYLAASAPQRAGEEALPGVLEALAPAGLLLGAAFLGLILLVARRRP
jgi:hypothetical protein